MNPATELGMEEFTHRFAIPRWIRGCEVKPKVRAWLQRRGLFWDLVERTVTGKCQFQGGK
jgi:hypothetical protein